MYSLHIYIEFLKLNNLQIIKNKVCVYYQRRVEANKKMKM